MNAVMRFKLKQYTPMIHFQYYEKGVCIRATELKPKLDRFLIKKYANRIRQSWKASDTDALRYKVRIFTKGDPEKSAEINRMYFGNMGKTEDDENYKETVFYNGNKTEIILEIFCLLPELRTLITECIDEFFFTTNFGTRQNKGFGSFGVFRDDNNPRPNEKIWEDGTRARQLLNTKGYPFFYAECKNMDYEKIMNAAAGVYAVIKGGVNYKNRNKKPIAYIKAYIQRQYLDDIDERDTGSDKAFMKSTIMPKGERPNEHNTYANYKYVRVLFGVADHIKFRDDLRKGTVEIKSESIERFQSPLLIKIIKGYVFFIFTGDYKPVLGQTFSFTARKNTGKINVPESFDPDQFISGFINYFNNPAVKSELEKVRNYSDAADITLRR